MRRLLAKSIFLLLWLAACATTASAAPCGGDFATWLQGVKQEAATHGISQRTIQIGTGERGLRSRHYRARSRPRRVPAKLRAIFRPHGAAADGARPAHDAAIWRGAQSLSSNNTACPGAVIVAIWGLETDFGADSGRFPTIRSLASLAYDCRRPDKFRGELIAALQIVERGDMSPAEMRGAWAGEIGQTQFLPSSYLKYAVGRDLIRNPTNALASTANYLKGYGWQRGQSWGEGSANFQVLLQWNSSQVYTKTVAYFAQQLAGVGQ